MIAIITKDKINLNINIFKTPYIGKKTAKTVPSAEEINTDNLFIL